MVRYVASIGMEVHAELMTRSKMFCRCPVSFGGEPNTRVCPVCLALPGALPVPNRAAIEMVLKTALALNCKIAERSVFHRKNYFYPDLPKGYQISQYGETNPIGYHGWLDFPRADGSTKRVRIRRVHLEEDTGKLLHLPAKAGGTGNSGVDYNRAGTPLMEIVTDFPPDIESSDDARDYLVQLRQILVYLGVCDGKMEEGSLRCEPNISVRPEGEEKLGTKTELKNLNSFRSVQLGVAFETRRQIAKLEAGELVAQETRGWNETSSTSFPMRTKEMENDYRYFPDPDLAVLTFAQKLIDDAKSSLPELPTEKRDRYRKQFGLSEYDVSLLIADREWADWFDLAVEAGGEPKAICNWMNSDFAKLLNEAGIRAPQSKLTPLHLVELSKLISEGTLNGKMAKEVLEQSFHSGHMPSEIVSERGDSQISDRSEILRSVERVISENGDVVAKFKSGQTSVKGFLVGQVMKATGGKANPRIAQELIEEALH